LYTKSILTTGATKTSPKDFIKFVKPHKIDVVIPSDTSDTMLLLTHHAEISKHVNLAVTPFLSVYESLEDKWETYNMCKELNTCTPDTTLFDPDNIPISEEQNNNNQHYPFFLKVASGTNAGRGVWHCKDDDDLKEALNQKEVTKHKKDVVLIEQKPVSGDIITAQIVFDNGTPVGSFFCQSVQSENLAGMGANWVNSQRDDIKDMVSDIKVELTDKQSEVLNEIFTKIGNKTSYHGMMDIEFTVNPIEGICLLEYNPRFSGGLHTTLSNHKFLDLYFDVVNNKNRNNNNSERKTLNEAPVCGNYSAGVEMKAKLGDFDPTGFYLKHPLQVLS
jgi:carbamoylphosphate synthase large subunit